MSYYTKITNSGLAAITTAMNNSSKVPITYMAFGDGNGSIPEPDENATSLVNEVYRVGVNKVEVHSKNPNWLVCEAIIPSAVGGFNIREVALYDSTGNNMLAIASYPPTYKPTVEEGAAKIQTIRIVIQVENSGNFELILDPDVVLATIESIQKLEKKLYKDTETTVECIEDLQSLEHIDGKIVYVKSYYKAENFALSQPYMGGSKRVFVKSRSNENDGFLCINGWVLIVQNNQVSPEQAGAKLDAKDFDSAESLQKTFLSGYEVICSSGTYYTTKPLYHRSSFKLRGQGFWSKTRIFKTTGNGINLPDVLSPNGVDYVSYNRDAVLIAIPDSGDYCHNVSIKNILLGREWDATSEFFLKGYSYFAPYLAQSEFTSVWCNATRYTWYTVNQWMCTFNRCEGAGGEWIVGGIEGDILRGGTTSTYNSCWSKVINIQMANAWRFTNMASVTMNSCGTDGLGKPDSIASSVIFAENSRITLNGFGIEVVHAESIFKFSSSVVDITNLTFHQVYNNYGKIFNIKGGIVVLATSGLELVNTNLGLSLPDFAIVDNNGYFSVKNVTCNPPLVEVSNTAKNKNAILIKNSSSANIESNVSKKSLFANAFADITNAAPQSTNDTLNIGVTNDSAIRHNTNSFQLGSAQVFRDSKGFLRQTLLNKPTSESDGVPVGGCPIYNEFSSPKQIEGNFYFDKNTRKLCIFDGEKWSQIQGT